MTRVLPIEVHDLTVSYQKKPVLYGVDLEIQEGSLVGILAVSYTHLTLPTSDLV